MDVQCQTGDRRVCSSNSCFSAFWKGESNLKLRLETQDSRCDQTGSLGWCGVASGHLPCGLSSWVSPQAGPRHSFICRPAWDCVKPLLIHTFLVPASTWSEAVYTVPVQLRPVGLRSHCCPLPLQPAARMSRGRACGCPPPCTPRVTHFWPLSHRPLTGPSDHNHRGVRYLQKRSLKA